MARTRMKGKGIVFTYDDVAYQCDLTAVVLQKDTADTATADSTQTFCDVDSGSASGNVWKMDITAIQSSDYTPEKALHQLIWDLAMTGGELDFMFAPAGNAVASQNQPHYSGSVIVDKGGYPSVGGDSGENTWTFDYNFVVKDDVVLRVGDADTAYATSTATNKK